MFTVDLRPVRGISCLVPYDSWDGLQLPTLLLLSLLSMYHTHVKETRKKQIALSLSAQLIKPQKHCKNKAVCVTLWILEMQLLYCELQFFIVYT